MRTVYTRAGMELALDDEPLGTGGEGAVHAVDGGAHLAVKLYARPEGRREKVVAMAHAWSGLDDLLLRRVAWPIVAVYDHADGSGFTGFAMFRLRTLMPFGTLYEYPAPRGMPVSMPQKLALLEELCDLVGRLHAAGQVVGDLNDGNVVLMAEGEDVHVGLVDADSFHATAQGATWRCTACKSGYMAPELIRACAGGRTFADAPGPTFTAQTDAFALAVHVFRMLFNGASPYSHAEATGSGSLPAPRRAEDRVLGCETPFFRRLDGKRIPRYAPASSLLPPYLRGLFRRALVEGHTDPHARPDAQEWGEALRRYRTQLVRCERDPAHWHAPGLAHCPYCAADRRVAAIARMAT